MATKQSKCLETFMHVHTISSFSHLELFQVESTTIVLPLSSSDDTTTQLTNSRGSRGVDEVASSWGAGERRGKMGFNLKFLRIFGKAMNVEIGLWPKFENWKKIHKEKTKTTNGIWTLELWNNLRETTNLNLVLKKKNKVWEVKNWKFEVQTL